MQPAPGTLSLRSVGWTRTVAIPATGLVLGRSRDCDLVLPDPAVSRQHCRLSPDTDGGWLVEDLGSRTGTFVNGVKIPAPVAVAPGTKIEIGETRLVLHHGQAAAAGLGDAGPGDAGLVTELLTAVDALAAAEELDELLATIVDRAGTVVGAQRGALLLAGAQSELEVAVARDIDAGSDLPPDAVLTRSLPLQALASGHAVVLAQAEQGSRPESIAEQELECVVCVPLPGTGSPAGVLYLDGRRPGGAFGAAELGLLEALCGRAVLAIERTRRRDEQRRRAAAEEQRLQAENERLRSRLGSLQPIGESPAMQRALELIRRVAAAETTICLQGETGTGKEVLARYLHRSSSRAGGPFVVVDCGAIPESLIESELFGHERGAFTGAHSARPGRFRQADGGTLLLDEIGELPLALQPRLLRVLQQWEVQPVGGTPVPVDVRVVCASHRDLEQLVADGQFREDLYYRLGVLTVPIPPLRERGEDILLLAEAFLARLAETAGSTPLRLTREASHTLLHHAWPGNVRELEHRLQRATLLSTTGFLTVADLGLEKLRTGDPQEPATVLPLQEARAQASQRFERDYLEQVLAQADGSVAAAARLAGVSRQRLYTMLRRHGLALGSPDR